MENEILNQYIAKNIFDKSQEKRDKGAEELMSFVSNAQDKQISEIIKLLSDKCISQGIQFNQKRGSLHGLYAVSMEMSKKDGQIKKFLNSILAPMLFLLKDKDEKLRYVAIEFLFLTCKSIGDVILNNLNEIYEKLIEAQVDTDEQVRRAAIQFDGALKSLVTSTAPEKQYFKLQPFVKILNEKGMQVINPQIKKNVITWIATLNSIPNIEFFDYLHIFLPSLFDILAHTQQKDQFTQPLKSDVDKQLEEFRKDIGRYSIKQSCNQEQEYKTHSNIIDILITQLEKSDENVLYCALEWILQYVEIMSKEITEEKPSQKNSLEVNSQLILKGLNFLNQTNPFFEQKKDSQLQTVIIEKLNPILGLVLELTSHTTQKISQIAQDINELLLSCMDNLKQQGKEPTNIMETIQEKLKDQNSITAEKALEWMRHLLKTQAEQLRPNIDKILENLIDRLQSADSKVAENVMDVLDNFQDNQYFQQVITQILRVLQLKDGLLNKMGQIIIQRICKIWGVERVYRQICANLLNEYIHKDQDGQNIQFAVQLIQTLEYFLLTESESADFAIVRKKLKHLKYEKNIEQQKQMNEFLEEIFKTFCWNQVSALSLTLLIEEYEITYKIIQSIAEQEADIETLIQIARLILLLESPVFAYLRLQLLEASKHPFLIQSLQGLMMLLPQSNLQKSLKSRLKNVALVCQDDIASFCSTKEIQFNVNKELLFGLLTQTKKEKQDLEENSKQLHLSQ